MTLAVCLDDENGLTFAGRRQSRDKEQLAHLAKKAGHLFIAPYSEPLGLPCPVTVAASLPGDAPADAVCFLEQLPADFSLAPFDTLLVYRWHRVYPADVRFPLPDWPLADAEDLVGFSHETITCETYRRP